MIRRFKLWLWKRRLCKVLYLRKGMIASQAWIDRMAMNHFDAGVSPRRAYAIEFEEAWP